MRVERYDGSIERRILTAMIVNDVVLAKVSTKWVMKGLLKSKWSNLIGSWCVKYHKKYGHAPKKHIVGLFESWSNSNPNKPEVDLIESYLASLSGEYESINNELNPDVVLDEASTYFGEVSARNVIAQAEGDLDNGDVDKAIKRLITFNKVEIASTDLSDWIDPQENKQDFTSSSGEVLVTYPGDLGVFLGDVFSRDSFVAFEGPAGVGKTFWLLDIAYRAVRQGRRVLFFEVGDLSKPQIRKRFAVRESRFPSKSPTKQWPCVIKYPTKMIKAKPGIRLDFKDKTYKGPISEAIAWKALEKLQKVKLKTNKSMLKFSCHPNFSISVYGIKSIVEDVIRTGWVPDCIVVDYADLLTPPPGIEEERTGINTTWMMLRSMSQQYHNLVVTATQTDTESYTTRIITKKNFSGDRRKNDHVSAMIAINQTDEEKEDGLCRLSFPKVREEYFNSQRVCHVAGCLALANPCVLSLS